MKRALLAILTLATAGAMHVGDAGAAGRPLVRCDTRAECRDIDDVIAFYRAAINDKDFAHTASGHSMF